MVKYICRIDSLCWLIGSDTRYGKIFRKTSKWLGGFQTLIGLSVRIIGIVGVLNYL
ncbi:MAG: hypothetical protein KKG04_00595 [Candidatus Thermoplasmatota archaeon]|nr:hypothetical protein [Candidatus Thermoplasmatota archaeon]